MTYLPTFDDLLGVLQLQLALHLYLTLHLSDIQHVFDIVVAEIQLLKLV